MTGIEFDRQPDDFPDREEHYMTQAELSKATLPAPPIIPSPFPNFDRRSRIELFDVAAVLSPKSAPVTRDDTCRDNKGVLVVWGATNASLIIKRLARAIEKLPVSHTLRIELSGIRATNDFIEEILTAFFFADGRYREITKGKQAVFFDPDFTTDLAIRRTIGSLGVMDTNCMVAKSDGGLPKTLWLVGHLEPRLLNFLEYMREHRFVTVKDLVQDKISRTIGNASGNVKELWDMGLIRREKVDEPADKVGRSAYRYTAYHPLLDFYPDYEIAQLHYDQLKVESFPRRRKGAVSE